MFVWLAVRCSGALRPLAGMIVQKHRPVDQHGRAFGIRAIIIGVDVPVGRSSLVGYYIG